MTFAEKARKEHPELCNQELGYPTMHCPHDVTFGYEKKHPMGWCSTRSCHQCWNREIPEEAHEAPVEEAKPKTTKKTKAQLLAEIGSLKEEVARLERYSQYENAANELYALKTAFVNSGFTEEQAFALIKELSSAAFKK